MHVDKQALMEENKKIRMLRISSDMLIQILMTTPVSPSRAVELVAGVRDLAVRLFPEKGETFDLIYVPRFIRALREAHSFAAADAVRRCFVNEQLINTIGGAGNDRLGSV